SLAMVIPLERQVVAIVQIVVDVAALMSGELRWMRRSRSLVLLRWHEKNARLHTALAHRRERERLQVDRPASIAQRESDADPGVGGALFPVAVCPLAGDYCVHAVCH